MLDIAKTMGWNSLDGVLLSQIQLADFLGQSSGFRRLLFQDTSLCAVVKALAMCIVDSKIDIITANFRLRLASNDVN